MTDISQLENVLGYHFSDISLLSQALVHPSYVGEHKTTANNQRLEYLGDAVLELAVSTALYHAFPDMHEGELSKQRARLVSEDALYTVASGFGLGSYIKMSNGELAAGGSEKPSIVSDAFEAVLGAVYLDGGYKAASETALRFIKTDASPAKDYKSRLQEELQCSGSVQVIYECVSAEGPPHDMHFDFTVSARGALLGKGSGRTKKAAQQDAARDALEKLKPNDRQTKIITAEDV